MKPIFTLLLILAVHTTFAQRKMDLQFVLLKPTADSIMIEQNSMIDQGGLITHNGGDTLKPGDSICIYLEENSNRVTFFNGVQVDSFIFITGKTLTAGDTVQVNFPPIGIAYPPGHYKTCIGFELRNASDALTDTLSSNDQDCVQMQVVPVSVENINTNTQPDIYPNPATNTIYIKGVANHTKVDIYNTVGRLVLSTQISVGEVDIHSLPDGTYHMNIADKQYNFIKQ